MDMYVHHIPVHNCDSIYVTETFCGKRYDLPQGLTNCCPVKGLLRITTLHILLVYKPDTYMYMCDWICED